jgi:hypothetical protein
LVTGWGTPTGKATIDALVQVSTPPVDCAKLQKVIANLQIQLETAEQKRTLPQCQGPASFNCAKQAQQIQQSLQAEQNFYRNHCGPGH